MLLESSENLSGVQKMGVGVDLVGVVSEDGRVEKENNPMTCEQKHNCKCCVCCRLGKDVVIQPVTQINGIDVVALQVGVHDCEEHLEKEVHQRDENRKDEGVRVGCHGDCGEKCANSDVGCVVKMLPGGRDSENVVSKI